VSSPLVAIQPGQRDAVVKACIGGLGVRGQCCLKFLIGRGVAIRFVFLQALPILDHPARHVRLGRLPGILRVRDQLLRGDIGRFVIAGLEAVLDDFVSALLAVPAVLLIGLLEGIQRGLRLVMVKPVEGFLVSLLRLWVGRTLSLLGLKATNSR